MNQIKQLLIDVLTKMNLWEQNAKSIDELPVASSVVPTAKIHVSESGTSKSLELQKLINASINSYINQITSIGEITVNGNDVTIPPASWKISNISYSKTTNTIINIPFSNPGTNRIDIIVANTLNQIYIVSGNNASEIAVRPNQPINTVLVTEINISQDSLSAIPFPLALNELDAINSSNNPSSTNPFATMEDINSGSNNLDEVLAQGDSAPSRNANIQELGLYDSFDSPNTPAGYSKIYSDKNRIWFKNKLGVILGSIFSGGYLFRKGIYNFILNTPDITENRTATLQNKSGVVAYLEDIQTPTLQQVNNAGNEIISADGKSKVVFIDGSVTFFYRVTLGADWIQTAQYSSSQFYLDDSYFYGSYSFKVDPWTGVTVDDINGNVINITPTSITKNGVEVVTFDDITGKEDKSNKGIAGGYTPLNSSSKIPENYLPDSILGQVKYKGVWDASTNTPTIPTASSANKGNYYIVNFDGSTAIDGISDWLVGDWIISNGATWNKVDNTDAISSFNERTGAIELLDNDVTSALGYIPENVGAKVTTVYGNSTSEFKYPSVKAIVDWVKDLFIVKQMSAYSMMANPSNATANAVEVPYISKGVQNLTGISFVGTTAPTGGTQHYQFEQVGNMVTCIMTGNYANAGTAITQVIIPFPTDLPNLTRPAGIAAAAGNKCYIVNGNLSVSPTTISLTATSSFVVCATDPSKYNVVGLTSSGSIKHFWFSFIYFTS